MFLDKPTYVRHDEIMDRGIPKNFDKFKEFALTIIDKDCWNPDGSPLSGKDRDILAFDFAINMHLGSQLMKNKYVTLGIITGISIMGGAFIIYKIIKKKKEEES